MREGMFVCRVCGSDALGDRPPPLTDEQRGVSADDLRQQARTRLTGFVTRGAGLVVAGFVVGLVSVLLTDPSGVDGRAGAAVVTAVVAWALGFAGTALLLCGIVGWGVTYGNEASTTPDTPR